jgi:HD-like signal output (HDOD) protein
MVILRLPGKGAVGMELHTMIFLILAGLLFFFIFLSLFLRGEQKKKAAKKPANKKSVSIPPGHEKLEPSTLPDLGKIEYSSLDMVVPPKKLEEIGEGLKTRVRKMLDNVPPLPASSMQLTNLLRDPQVSAKQVAALVSTNPLISSRILRTVNSSYFGLSAKVTSVGRAITLLGFNNVQAIVMREALAATSPTFKNKDLANTDILWLHSTVVSACSLYLSKNVLAYAEHDLGTIGLFHDIGKYFLTPIESHIEAELEMPSLILSTDSGIDHALLGSMLAAHWQMPEVVVKCIEYHHYPTYFPPAEIPVPYQKPAFILCLADLICRSLGYVGPHVELLPIRQDYYDYFHLPSDLTNLVSRSLLKEIDKARIAVESYLEG